MAVTFYQSTDASAPVLTGQVGKLIALLKAILVDGYGSMAAAGWAYTYNDGASPNQEAVFTQGSGSNGYKLYVKDSGGLTGGAREALVRGAESASAYNTLTDPFPTVALAADNSCVWRKSDTADATARTWKAIANEKFIALWVNFSGSSACEVYFFGDLINLYGSGSSYLTMITHRNSANSSTTGLCWAANITVIPAIGATNQTITLARSYDGLVKSSRALVRCHGNVVLGVQYTNAASPASNTNLGGKLPHIKIEVWDTYSTSSTPGAGAAPVGLIPYLHEPLATTYTGWAFLDTFSNSSYGGGSTFMLIPLGSATASPINNSSYSKLVFQTSGTFDAT